MTLDPGERATAELLARLASEELVVLGQLRSASNATLLCEFAGAPAGQRVVYKPVAGERALWDFPEATLALREVAAYEVSSLLGWDLVPATAWREEGPYGPGSCQVWVDEAGEQPVRVCPAGTASALVVVSGQDAAGNELAVEHDDSTELQRIAVFDAIVNNADRKGGHIISDELSRAWCIDHGVCFSDEPKLRTVLWGWMGQDIPADLVSTIASTAPALRAWLDERAGFLSQAEQAAFLARVEGLLECPRFPEPTGEWPFLPWPVM